MTDETTPQNEENMTEETGGPFDAFVDHQRRAFEEMGKALDSLIPESFKGHAQSAFKESIEGYRKLFNSALDEINAAVERTGLSFRKGQEAGEEEAVEVKDE
jgi:hypothetical protein